jgi:hypothetical protein
MSRQTALRAFLIGAPLPFAALLTQHPMGTGDLFTEISGKVTPWLTIHYAGAVFFPLMALVIWLLIRDTSGRAATIARFALPVYAVFYTVWEAVFGIASGIIADAGNGLSGAEHRGAAEAVDAIVSSPIMGESGVFVSIGSVAWWVGISASIMALKHAGVRPVALVLLGLGGLMVFHVPIGPPALLCLSAAAYLIERARPAPSRSRLPRPVGQGSAFARERGTR